MYPKAGELGPKKWGKVLHLPGYCWSCHPFLGQPPTQSHPQPQGQEVGPGLEGEVRSFLAPHCCFHYSVTFCKSPVPPSTVFTGVVYRPCLFSLLKSFGVPPPSASWVTLKSQPLHSTAFTCLITVSSAYTLVHILDIFTNL